METVLCLSDLRISVEGRRELGAVVAVDLTRDQDVGLHYRLESSGRLDQLVASLPQDQRGGRRFGVRATRAGPPRRRGSTCRGRGAPDGLLRHHQRRPRHEPADVAGSLTACATPPAASRPATTSVASSPAAITSASVVSRSAFPTQNRSPAGGGICSASGDADAHRASNCGRLKSLAKRRPEYHTGSPARFTSPGASAGARHSAGTPPFRRLTSEALLLTYLAASESSFIG